MSGFWDASLKGRAILKAGIIILGLFVVAVGALWAFVSFNMKPPKEEKLIANFLAHRATYEQLRNMLLEDRQVDAVYTAWGARTTTSGLPRKPSEVNFSVGRYNDYVALLRQVGSNAVFRSEGDPVFVCVGAWAAGWAGNTRHVWVCATDQPPSNEVSSLDNYYRGRKSPRDVFKRIEGDWYLKADW